MKSDLNYVLPRYIKEVTIIIMTTAIASRGKMAAGGRCIFPNGVLTERPFAKRMRPATIENNMINKPSITKKVTKLA